MITSFIDIKIKRDNYAYLTIKGDNNLHNAKLFELLQESFKREIKSYNPVTRYYNVRTKSFFKLMMKDGKKKNNRAYDMIRVKAGLIPYLCKSLEDRNISYSLDETDRQKLIISDEDDKLVFKLNDKVELRDYQKEAVKAVFEKGYCGIQLVTGSGKSECSASIIRTYFNNCTDKNKAVLYVVPTLKLQLESEERFNQYGILDCNKQLPLIVGKVNIITYMSLVRCEVENPEIVGCLIFDEAQHLKGDKARDIIHKFNNLDMCVGLSATLTKDIENKKYLKNLDETDLSVLGSLGEIAYFKPIKDTIDDKFVTPVKVYVVDNPEKVKLKVNDWLLVKNYVLKSQHRAEFVAEFIEHTMKVGNFNTLCILIPEIEWSRQYMLEIAKTCKDARIILTYGGERYEEIIDGELKSLNPEEKQEAEAAIRNPNVKTIFSCTTYFFEGVNIPCIQGVVNCYGGRSTVKVKQQLGRAMRLFEGKDVAYIFEIHDDNPVMESQLKHRLAIYKNEYGAKIIKSRFRS